MMLLYLRSHSKQFVANGKCILRNSSTFHRDRKYYEMTLDADEQEMKNRPNPLADIEHRINESKKKLIWRQPPVKQFSMVSELLGMFSSERRKAANLQRIVQPLNFDMSWTKFKIERDRIRVLTESLMQSFIPERHEILGNNLAAAHFLIHRGAQVRFTKSPEWMKMDENDEYDLPSRFNPNWIISDIKCDGMALYYEGLENIRRLYQLKTFSLKNVKTFDDWCMDRLAGNQLDSLEVLDISGTNITTNGLVALPKIQSLKVLIISDIKRSPAFELSLHMLQDIMPDLEIRETESSTSKDTQQTSTPPKS